MGDRERQDDVLKGAGSLLGACFSNPSRELRDLLEKQINARLIPANSNALTTTAETVLAEIKKARAA